MILTDDVGYDDVGFHNPRVNTPNINRFRQRSTVFENFYTAPQCAQSRAQFLTGRSYARTGTMAVSGGKGHARSAAAAAAATSGMLVAVPHWQVVCQDWHDGGVRR
jgi:arylsulfatase A-like enzyme